MRLLVCNWTGRNVGGIEDYLSLILPELHLHGYELAFASEVDLQKSRSVIALPSGTPHWCVAELGQASVLEKIQTWRPQLIYCHGPLSGTLESSLFKVAPAIYFAHNYYGTCVGGYKAHRLPTPRPCNRTLGWPCLVQYFPRQCGGRSPITMFRRYNQERARLARLKRYRAIVTHSEHMRQEYIKHGIASDRIFGYIADRNLHPIDSHSVSNLINISTADPGPAKNARRSRQIFFLGRMENLKGGQTLIASAPIVQKHLGVPIRIVFGGDGPEKEHWQNLSEKASAASPALSFSFPGWLDKQQVADELDKSDAMAVPSLWPEPFGRVGLQAGSQGIPVAAFAVGGIPEWLQNGVNGCLAPADPPTPEGLAHALTQCLDEDLAPTLRVGARKLANRFSTQLHIAHLLKIFENLASTE